MSSWSTLAVTVSILAESVEHGTVVVTVAVDVTVTIST